MRSIAVWVLLILIFTIPWENAITLSGIGTLTRVMGLVLITMWLLAILAKGRIRKPNLFHLVFLLFIQVNIVSIFWTHDITATKERIISYIQLFIFVLILWDLFDKQNIFQAGLQAYVLGAYVSIIGILYNYYNGVVVSPYGFNRNTGVNINANDLALILSLGIPVAWHLAIINANRTKGFILKIVNYAYIPAAFFSIVLTGSRMSLFVMVPVLVYILGTIRQLKIGIRLLVFSTLIGAMIALQNYIPQSSIDRFTTIGASIAERDLGGRVAIWFAASSVFSAHPLLGIGGGSLPAIIGGVAHNTFLSVLAELGFIGFILFILVLATVVYCAIHQSKKYSALWLTILLIWAIGVSTLTWEAYKPTWLFMSLIVTSAYLWNHPMVSKPKNRRKNFNSLLIEPDV